LTWSLVLSYRISNDVRDVQSDFRNTVCTLCAFKWCTLVSEETHT